MGSATIDASTGDFHMFAFVFLRSHANYGRSMPHTRQMEGTKHARGRERVKRWKERADGEGGSG